MWHKKNGRRGFLGSLKSLFGSRNFRKARNSHRNGSSESLEDRIVLSAQYVENHVLLSLNQGAFESVNDAAAVALSKPEIEPLGNYGLFLATLPAGVAVPDARLPPTRDARIDRFRSGSSFYFGLLATIVRSDGHEARDVYDSPSPDRWPDRACQSCRGGYTA